MTQTTAPDASTNKTFYNETTKPSSALSTVGNTVRSQDAWGRERWARSDDWGRLVEVVEPDANGTGSVTAAGNMVTRYTYDAVDQLTLITQGSQTRSFKYDSLGRMTRQKLAEQTATINDAGTYVGAGVLTTIGTVTLRTGGTVAANTVPRTPSVLGHIFKNATGHVNPATAASQARYLKLFESVANNARNLNPNVLSSGQRAAGGIQGFSQTFGNGSQVWVHVANGRIFNAGVNLIPK